MPDQAPPAKLRSARDAPQYFAGRRMELAALRRRVDDVWETGDPTGGMSLIIGVPGAGKTQLAREFVHRNGRCEGEPDVRSVTVDTTLLESGVDVFLEIGHALDSREAFLESAQMDARTTSGGGAIGPFKADVAREHVRHTAGLTVLLRKTHRAGAWAGKVLVVVVDELQAVSPDGLANLRVLHEGAHGCPLLLLGVGLQHTPAVLAHPKAGISRVAQTIHLHSLPAEDALDAVEGNMRALGHAIPRSCAESLAAASHGFPQHIHGYLAGAFAAIAEFGRLDEGPPLESALAAGRRAREDYYNDRLNLLSDGIEPMLALVDGLERRRTEALPIGEAARAIANAGFAGRDDVDEAMMRGVLAKSPQGDVSFGIPSFHAHMVELRDARSRRRCAP